MPPASSTPRTLTLRCILPSSVTVERGEMADDVQSLLPNGSLQAAPLFRHWPRPPKQSGGVGTRFAWNFVTARLAEAVAASRTETKMAVRMGLSFAGRAVRAS